MIVTHAMVLAAGLGTRMRPLTLTTPKPLVNVAGRTLLDWALDNLSTTGVEHAVVNLHHLGAQIKAHLNHRTYPQVTTLYEDPLLETGGGIQNALPLLGDAPFFVINSDGLWLDDDANALALRHMADRWDDAVMDALLLLHDPVKAFGYDGPGDFTIGSDGRLARRTEGAADAKVFTGVQLLHPRLFKDAPGGIYSLNVLYNQALGNGRLFGLTHAGEWHHVGTPEALETSDRHLRNRGFGR
ncbi:MAG: nucleotidyltransferase family protein [Rhodospirillales bacterium]|nr:nucleotidyltransferase family protein [Rhodospirillales bacterium]